MRQGCCGKTNPLAGLLAGYKNKVRVPSFSGVLEVVHSMPGRIRIKVPSLKNNLAGAESFKQKLSHLRGIQQIEVNLFLGTVLLKYDSQTLTPMLVVSAASHCFDFEQAMRANRSALGREVKSFRFAIDQALLRNTYGIIDLRSAMTLALTITLVRGIIRHGSSQFTPLNIVWWLYQSIDR